MFIATCLNCLSIENYFEKLKNLPKNDQADQAEQGEINE